MTRISSQPVQENLLHFILIYFNEWQMFETTVPYISTKIDAFACDNVEKRNETQ